MRFSLWKTLLIGAAVIPFSLAIHSAESTNQPEPPVIDPGPVGGPPSDALVLFDGKDL